MCEKGMIDTCGVIEFALANDLDIVQLCDNLPLFSLDAFQLDTIKGHCAGKIDIETGFKVSDFKGLIDCIELTRALGAHKMRLVLYNVVFANNFLFDKTNLCVLAGLLEMYDIEIMFENHFEYSPVDTLNLVRFALSCSTRFSICFDCFNSLIWNYSTFETLDLLRPYISEVHIKDVVIARHGLGLKVTGCDLGEGVLDIGRLFKEFEGKKFPSLVLEGWSEKNDIVVEQEKESAYAGIHVLKEMRKHV